MTNIKQEDFERIFKQHLKIETYSKTIDSLLGPRSLNKINYSPYYQRNYVWDVSKASYFIESILLGTEIPPLIFFNNNSEIEVIDGRQRFETILRFTKNEFALTQKGLPSLTQLAKLSFDDIAKKDNSIIESFLDSKLRVIEFALVNEPPLDKYLEDRVKKEIFSRYNSGITPLKKSEIDNAIYDENLISTKFKQLFQKDKKLLFLFYKTFFLVKENEVNNPPLDKILEFIRRYIVLPKCPINYFARSSKTAIISKLYEYLSDTVEKEDELVNAFIEKSKIVASAQEIAEKNDFKSNRFIYQCLLWAICVCEEEGVRLDLFTDDLKYDYVKFASENINRYNDKDFHFYKEILERFNTTASFFANKFNINLDIYITASAQEREHIKELKKNKDTKSKIGQLDSLRLNKPDPTKNSIEDIIRVMQRRKFLVRPSYQRKEVVNLPKASSIIESILLGIALPAIFIYKREDGVSEVIDGQQRLLTILGYIGSEYIDENNKTVTSKNHKFALRKPRILNELDGVKYDKLSEVQKNKILDFQLYVVTIEEVNNPDFDPIDLFIRLNDKPYPIREHSFEMWNSWADFELIKKIREVTNYSNSWFFLKQLKTSKDRDRMENEELITSLIFLDYYSGKKETRKIFDIYQKADRINARIGDKAYVSQLLNEASEFEQTKKEFLVSIKNCESFIKKLKYILLDRDKKSDELFDYLKIELDNVLKGNRKTHSFRRTMQDFYILHHLINELNTEMVRYHRIAMKKEITEIFSYIKNIHENDLENGKGLENYFELHRQFKEKYKKDDRKLKFSEEQKLVLIKSQQNISGLSSAPIFLGDEVEPDHTRAIAIGGKDSLDNITIAHKDENRSKGAKNVK
jgi:hypothetical protein